MRENIAFCEIIESILKKAKKYQNLLKNFNS